MRFISKKEEKYIFERLWRSDVEVYVKSWDITPDGPTQRQDNLEVYLRNVEVLEMDLREVGNLLKTINKRREKHIKMEKNQLEF